MVKAISQFSKEMNTYNNMHFLDGVDETSEYTYNANGCMTKDKNKGFQTVRYNQLSLPSYVKTKKGPSEKITYNIRGEKLRIRKNMQIDVPRPWLDSITPATPHVYPVIEQPDMSSLQDFVVNPAIGEIVPFPTIDYCGSVVYNNNQLQYVLVEGGFISFDENTPVYHFYLRDHLGSNRVVTTHTGQVEQRNMFYPYGASRADCWSDSAMVQRWKYSGKELDNFQGLHCYDYGFRWYDPIICRWTTPDPMREKYYDFSAYAYCAGNPICLMDVNGDTISVMNKMSQFLFALDDGSSKMSKMSVRQLYKKGVQWFAPTADNYMPLLYMNKYISKMEGIKHFSWNDIVAFAEIDRSPLAYWERMPGDWKRSSKGGAGYYMVTVDGYPYWSDAIGQIPFTLNTFRDGLRYTANYQYSVEQTVKIGKSFQHGFFDPFHPDNSNSYDNEMIKRALIWAVKRYDIVGVNEWNKNFNLKNTGYSPSLLSRPIQ